MRIQFLAKRIPLSTFFVCVAALASAQTRMTISGGARVNLDTAVVLSANHLALNNGGQLNVVAESRLKIAGDVNSSNGINAQDGFLEMNGANNQQISANAFVKNQIKYLEINSGAEVAVLGKLSLTDELKLSNGALDGRGFFALKSTAAKTAWVAPVTSNATTPGKGIVVERFIPAKRAFRFLIAPVNTTGDIRANWMENTNNTSPYANNNPNPGYGTQITGAGSSTNGFDATNTNNASMFTYDNTAQAWVKVSNTFGTMTASRPYRLLVRGDRSIDLGVNNPPPTNTTLRATGTLVTGTIVFSSPAGNGTNGFKVLSPGTNGYSFIGNPYASSLDWNKVELNDVQNTIYIFDPTLSGTNGRGAYVAYNRLTGTNNAASNVDQHLQSGQAFFVKNSGPNPTITVRESHKSTFNRAVFRTTSDNLSRLAVQLLLPGQDTTNDAADGVTVCYSDNFQNSLGEEDAFKYSNPDENLAIITSDSLLSIDGRKGLFITDTVQLRITQMNQKTYQFRTIASNMDPNITPYLEDNYLQTITVLDNTGTSYVPFTVTADTASFSARRFRIIFRNAGTLPLTFAGIKAYEKGKGVQVDWNVNAETNMNRHEVERSANGQQYTKMGEVRANNQPASMYTWFDENPLKGDSYYRIRSVSNTGSVKYSPIAKVHINSKANEITLIANASSTNAIAVQLKNATSGTYPVTLINNAGQNVYVGTLKYSAGNTETIRLANLLAAGIYRLQVIIGDKTYSAAVLIN